MTKKLLCGIFVFTLAMMCASPVMAGPVSATQSVNGGVVSVSITYAGNLSALGYQADLPEGVAIASVSADNTLSIKPAAGATGTVDFAWIDVPTSPITFTYTVAGTGDIGAQVLYRRGAGDEIVVNVE